MRRSNNKSWEIVKYIARRRARRFTPFPHVALSLCATPMSLSGKQLFPNRLFAPSSLSSSRPVSTLAQQTRSSSIMSTWSDRVSGGFGCLCILSALPLLGIPFPSRGWAFYYADKNIWMLQLTKCYLTLK